VDALFMADSLRAAMGPQTHQNLSNDARKGGQDKEYGWF